MAGEISGVTPKVPNTIDQMSDLTKGLGLSEKTTQTIKDVAAIISSRSVNVTSNVNSTNEAGRPTGATNIPALDNPADIKQLEENLEKLISYLQMDNEERQAQMAKDRINLQKDALETERQGRSEKIEKSLKDMDKAAESRKASKIFGWLMTALAVVAAVVACVATGGLAVGPVIGAGIAIACQVLSETGVMDKIVEKLAKGLESLGMSKQAAQILAQVLITAGCARIGCGREELRHLPKDILQLLEDLFEFLLALIQTLLKRRDELVGLRDEQVHHRAPAASERVRGGTRADPPAAPERPRTGGAASDVRYKHEQRDRQQPRTDGVRGRKPKGTLT